MNKSPQTQSGIKRARTDHARNYSDVLVTPHGSNTQNVYGHAEKDDDEQFRDDGSMQSTENASPTGSIDEIEIFVLDPTTMAWYIEPEDQAQYLMTFLHTQHCYGNTYVQGALVNMATGLQRRMVEMYHLNEKDRQQEEEINRLRIQNKGVTDLNERLEKDNQCIPDLQVFAVGLDRPLLLLTALIPTGKATRIRSQLRKLYRGIEDA
jgi:hypothetical protein